MFYSREGVWQKRTLHSIFRSENHINLKLHLAKVCNLGREILLCFILLHTTNLRKRTRFSSYFNSQGQRGQRLTILFSQGPGFIPIDSVACFMFATSSLCFCVKPYRCCCCHIWLAHSYAFLCLRTAGIYIERKFLATLVFNQSFRSFLTLSITS